MKNFKILALFLAVIMISMGLTACGGDKKEDKPAVQSKTSDTKEKEDAPKNTAKNTESDDEDTESNDENTESNDENTEETPSTAETLKAILSIGYVGVDTEGTTIYWAVSKDVDYGVLLAVSADKTQKISFVGDIAENGTQLTITDQSTGNSRTVDVQPIETSDGDKGIQFTDEQGDITALFPVEVDKVIDAMLEAEAQ